ncbi:PEGA domain-containing protein [Candidatus Parcubacteria bacterium]|nr:PEGA domain-containing protein [Candidatus Parcubacteria bacterium]
MQLSTRRRLFVASVVVFAILAPVITGYALGYRFDTRSGIVRTGALLIETSPGGAAVIIDKVLVKHTGTIFGGTALVRDISARSHIVRIEKPGYHVWEKEVEVRAAMVTGIRNVRLWPLGPTIENLGPLAAEESRLVPGTVRFSPDSTRLLWSVENRRAGERTWLVRRLPNGSPEQLTLPVGASPEEARVRWSSDGLFLVVETKSSWWRIDRDRFDTPATLPTVPLPRQLLNAEAVLAIDSFGVLTAYQISSSSSQALSRVPTITFSALDDELIAPDSEHVALLTRDGALRVFDADTRAFVGIASDAAEASFSPDRTKLLWRTNRELWLRTGATNELLTRFENPIQDAVWDKHGAYIFFVAGGTLKAIELDPRSGRITTDLLELSAAHLALDHDQNTVLAVNEAGLVKIHLP